MSRHKKPTLNHDDWVAGYLKNDTKLAAEYLRGAMDESGQEAGHYVLLRAMQQLAKAQELGKVAKRAGIPRESLSRMLSARGNPRLSSFFAVLKAMDLTISLQPARK